MVILARNAVEDKKLRALFHIVRGNRKGLTLKFARGLVLNALIQSNPRNWATILLGPRLAFECSSRTYHFFRRRSLFIKARQKEKGSKPPMRNYFEWADTVHFLENISRLPLQPPF